MALKTKVLWIFVLAFSLLVLYYFGKNTPNIQSSHFAKETVIDEYMVGANIHQFDQQGKLKQKLFIKKASHTQREDHVVIEDPHITLFFEDDSIAKIKSETGKSYHIAKNKQDKLELFDDVELKLYNSTANLARLETDFLTILTKKQLAFTEANVTIYSNNGIIKAQGMSSDLKMGVLNLFNRVTTLYDTHSTL